MSEPKYPHIKVKLTGNDGNAFMILGRIKTEMRRARVPAKEIEEFLDEATSGTYEHLLTTCMKWVRVT